MIHSFISLQSVIQLISHVFTNLVLTLSLGLQHNISQQHYRAVVGDTFMMPCLKCQSQHQKEGLSRTEGGREGNDCPCWLRDCGRTFTVESKHSGNYTCFIW